MLYTVEDDRQKIAVMMGEGIWKWRLSEFQETEKTNTFDEVFSKLLQYLSTQDDRRKFRCFPLQHEFTSDGPVVMESQWDKNYGQRQLESNNCISKLL